MISEIHGSGDDEIQKSSKSRYSPLDRGALTTKVCRHNSCLRSAIFIKMCTEMDQQKIESKSEILDIHDFQWKILNLEIMDFGDSKSENQDS